MSITEKPGSCPPQSLPTLGRYVLTRKIAQSFDVVWEATDPVLDRHVAVKELLLPHSLTGQAKEERLKRFYREARAAGALSHPNIVTIHEVGEDNGRHFIAMEFLEGHTLRERLNTGGAMTPAKAVEIAVALCDALEYAHAHNVIHRDIKPDNVHLLPDGRVKLTDFGIARITNEDTLTLVGQVVGTPSYMSPEQVTGSDLDQRSDIFSLGILLYELVAGKRPFTGDSAVTITYSILNDPMPPLAGVPPALKVVLRRAMEKDPHARFSTAAEMRAALRAALPGALPDLVVMPQPASKFRRAPHSPRKKTVTAIHRTAGILRPGRIPRRVRVILLAAVVCLLPLIYVNASRLARRNAEMKVYEKAADEVRFGRFPEAAEEFGWLRQNSRNTRMVQEATLSEVKCYRVLGWRSLRQNDLITAERWFQKALSVAPNDAGARQDLDELRKRREVHAPAAPRNAPPAPVPEEPLPL